MDVNRIIYTYKKPKFKIYKEPTNQGKWLMGSLKSIDGLGYIPTLYTNDVEFGNKFDIDVRYIDDTYDNSWDSFKLYVLENEPIDDYFISDNDVIYKNRIKFDDSDLFFDGIETLNWEWAYSKTIEYIKNNIDTNLSYWENYKRGVYNVGILRIPNLELKNRYITDWKYMYNILNKHSHNLNPTFTTATHTQYLLTLLSKEYSYNYFSDGTDFLKGNEYYTHYCGYLKMRNMPDEVRTLI